MSYQGIVSAGKNIQSLVINLKQGSALNKRFNKDLDTNYDSEFKNMHKSILNVEKIWSRIEDDFFIGESIEESSDLTEADKISFPFAWGYIDSVLKDFKVHAKKAKLGLEPIQLDVVQKLIDKLRKEAYVKAAKEFKQFKK